MKDKIIEIFKKHQGENYGAYGVFDDDYSAVATEILALFEKPKHCKHERQSIESIDHCETIKKCVDCGKILHIPERF